MQSAQVSAWPFLYQTDLCVWVCVYLPPVSYTWIFNEKDFDIFSKCIVCDVFLNVFLCLELQHTDMKNVIKAPVPYSRCAGKK